jgi:serine/threonine-protein kinase
MTPTLLNNRYRILRKLGAGGFGNTFLAEDTYMPSGRRCVIKQLKPVTHDPQAYKIVQERFQREAAVLEELGEGNPQIPRLYAYFSEAGQFYLVQEYIEGDTLTQKVERDGVLSDRDVEKILTSLLPVLDYVHRNRMIHRDIKPDNVIIRQRDGLPVLIDFGAVKEAMNTLVNAPGTPAHSMVIGTPGYMPPEQAGGRPTYASDLYGLGLTAVFLLTGKMPQELPTDQHTGEILWQQNAGKINPHLAKVIDRAIRFHARDRYATAQEMLNALQSNDGLSEMDTVAVAPGQRQPVPNRQIPPIANPSPQPTVPVGNQPVIRRNQRNPLLIGALILGAILIGGVALALGLRRESPGPVVSKSDPTTEEPAPETQQPRPPVARSPSQPIDSAPAPEPPISQPRPERNPIPRSQPRETTPPPVVSESPVERSPQPSPRQDNPPTSNLNQRIPGFPPGTQRSYITQELGEPTKVTSGQWNTRAVSYVNFIPGQVNLGYLFDPSSGRLRETEASFAQSVDLETISSTLDEMLNNNTSADIQQGLEQVYQSQSRRYKFTSGRNQSLEGLIEREKGDRIYIAVWEADLR